MKTTEHPAKTPSAKTGLFPKLRGLLHVDGSSAPSPARTRLAFTAACASFIAAGALLGTSSATAIAAESACPNEARRAEQGVAGLALPDCRAYELVSAPGVEPFFESSGASEANYIEAGQRALGWPWALSEASVSGDRMAFFSVYAPGSTGNTPFFLSTRGQAGWSTESTIPPQSTTNTGVTCYNAYPAVYSPDLSKWILADGEGQGPNEHNCATDEPLLVPGEPQGFQNLFLRDNEAGSYQLINVTPSAVAPRDAWLQAASTDLSHVVFSESAQLTPEAPPITEEFFTSEDLYESSGGVVHLVTFLPDGTPVPGSLADADEPNRFNGLGSELFTHPVSADGSRVFFVANGNLYLRENPDQPQSALSGEECSEPSNACTVQLDASQAGGSGGGGTFKWANTDGSQVFFADDASAGLTADTQPGSGQNLYRYDVEAGELTDLTPAAEAGVLGVSGASEDGSYLYFVAEGALTATPNSEGESATAGQPNLYLSHGGAITFIATLDPSSDQLDWKSNSLKSALTARVSPNGAFIGFNSLRSLTGYDNTPINPAECGTAPSGVFQPEPCQEIFLYGAAQNELSCASCDSNPSVKPTAAARILPPVRTGGLPERHTAAVPQRYVTDNGRVFFNTPDALLPRDINGQADVYEYEGGQLHLVSTGTASFPSYFYDASPSGNDAFFVTAQKLVPSDTDSGISVYDARVNGGFPEPPPPPICETEEACHRQQQQPPASSTSGSSHFEGPEEGPNHPRPHRCRKGQVRRHGKCVKRQHHHHKRHRRHARQAGRNRGGVQ